MENQNGTVDRMVEQLADARDDFATPTGTLEHAPSVGTYATREYSVEVTPVPDGPGSASLSGSLSVFTLSDVLTLLAATGQTGELHVVSETAEGKLWFENGDLAEAEVGSTATLNQAFFELACMTGGWFSFTADQPSADHSSSLSTGTAVPVTTVLAEVGPQVEEWRSIRQLLPLEALVTLSPEPPGEDVRIRNDQWRVLTRVGTSGQSVKSVLDAIGGDQIVGLRTLRDLHIAGLIDLEPTPAEPSIDAVPPASPTEADDSAEATSAVSPSLVTSTDSVSADLGSVPPPHQEDGETGDGTGATRLAEVTIMPPPIAVDPWAPLAVPTEAEGDGVA
jgi:hypothetical protein